MRNVLSIDVEEWFCVSNFAGVIRPEDWPSLESRVEMQIEHILEILEHHGVKATFFLLGWVAERHPDMVRTLVSRGHEIASHGYGHGLVSKMEPILFQKDISKSLAIIREISGVECKGYRAPSFSIRREMAWAWRILAEMGIEFDSSVFPVVHDRYGEPDAPRVPFQITIGPRALWEIPLSTVRFAGRNLPVAGGGYLRLFPYAFTRWAIRRLNREGIPGIVYFHPWEIDPGQPRPDVSPILLWRHRVGLGSFARKLDRLLSDFEFGTLGERVRELNAPIRL